MKYVMTYSSPANGILGRPEDTDDFFSKISMQLFSEFSKITRLPRTVTELTGPIANISVWMITIEWRMIYSPYRPLNFDQWSHSKLSGISKKLPKIGHPLGPGGKGREYLYLNFVTRINRRGVRTPKTKRRDTVIFERDIIIAVLWWDARFEY